MRKLYTGPFNPLARKIWTQKAKKMIEEGKAERFLYILPTSQLLKRVREDLLHSLGGLSQVYLLTFDEIAQKVTRELNPEASLLSSYELHRCYDQLLAQLIDHPMMKEFKEHYHLRGVRNSLMKMMGELKRSGYTIQQAKGMLENSKLNARSRALAFFFIESERYLQEISGSKPLLTRESRLELASKWINEPAREIPWLESLDTLWVDHFTDFSPLQLGLLKGLLKLPNMRQVGVYLPYQTNYYRNLNYLHPLIQQSIQDLQSLNLDWVDFSQSSSQETIEQLGSDWQVEKDANMTVHPSTNVLKQMISCPTTKSEVQFVCKDLKVQMKKNPELRLEDVAIVVRDQDRYRSLTQEELSREGLPVQQSKQIDLDWVPLVQQLLSWLEVNMRNWQKDSMAKLVAGSYIDWDHTPTPYVSNWMKRKGSSLVGYSRWLQQLDWDLQILEQKRNEQGSDASMEGDQLECRELMRAKDWLREVHDKLSVFSSHATMEQYCQAAKKWLHSARIPRRLVMLVKESNYQQQSLKRDLQAYTLIEKSLEELLLSSQKVSELDRRVSFSTFVNEWRELWNEQKITLRPGNENGVYVLEPSAARGLLFKQVYILGCNEGVFPKTHRENWLLDDSERLVIQELGSLPASHYQNEMEQIFFYMADSLSRERVVYSYVSTEKEGSLQPSSFIQAMMETNPGLIVQEHKDGWAIDQELLSSSEEYQQWLLKLGRQTLSHIHLYREAWLQRRKFKHVLEGIQIEHVRQFGTFGEWDGNLLGTDIEQELQRLFSPARRYSVSQLNEYISSPLTFFFQRVLGVKPAEEGMNEVSASDKGNILHETLRKFYSQHRREVLSASNLPSYEVELTQYLLEEAKRFAQGSIYERSKLWEFEVQRLARDLRDWLKNGLTEQKVDHFFPAFLELSFGLPFNEEDQVDPDSQTEYMELELGTDKVRLYGKIDRIDRDEQGHFILYDYKLSLSKYGDYKDLSDGTVNYQLPLYLALTKQWLKQRGEDEPLMVGGAFYSLRRKDQYKKVGMWSESKREIAGLSKRAKKGIFSSLDDRVKQDLIQIEEFLRRLRQGAFYLTSKQRPNPYFADNAIYRYDAISMRHKEKQKESLMP